MSYFIGLLFAVLIMVVFPPAAFLFVPMIIGGVVLRLIGGKSE